MKSKIFGFSYIASVITVLIFLFIIFFSIQCSKDSSGSKIGFRIDKAIEITDYEEDLEEAIALNILTQNTMLAAKYLLLFYHPLP